MNLPLRLAGCFVRHFVGVRGYLRSVRGYFVGGCGYIVEC